MFNFQDRYNKQIAFWLFVCATVILTMILLGGVTRLTHSGLSMVEWQPLIGIIPPLNEADWQQAFHKYQQFPEYQKINHGMDLEGFKMIFMYEYLHRLLGRFIGVLFLLPLLFFYFCHRIPKGLTHKLVIIFLLGGLQGLLGWYMVKSGLVDNPRVSQYRLTAHLGAAVFIYGYILWVAFGLVGKHQQRWYPAGLRNFSYLLTSLIFLMILSGGLVAGTRAGLAYPTFPLMGDSFIPQGLYSMAPAWLSAFEDITTIQFNHRMLAYLILTLGLLLVIHICRSHVSAQLRAASYCLVAALLIQVTLGITTLLQHVPVALASSHQAGAIALFTVALFYQPQPAQAKNLPACGSLLLNRITVIALAAALLLMAVIGSSLLHENTQKPLPVLEGLGGDFTLPGTEGRDVSLSRFRGKVVLLNFGFTSCPDVCPTVLAKMRKVLELLPDAANDLQPLFVTIDPERDSLEHLHHYLSYFHPSIIGLRGNSQQLQQVASLYKVLYQKEDINSALEYGFLHNDHIYLIDQQGKVRAMYSGSATPQAIADQIASLL